MMPLGQLERFAYGRQGRLELSEAPMGLARASTVEATSLVAMLFNRSRSAKRQMLSAAIAASSAACARCAVDADSSRAHESERSRLLPRSDSVRHITSVWSSSRSECGLVWSEPRVARSIADPTTAEI